MTLTQLDLHGGYRAVTSTAWLSSCGTYRYALWRSWYAFAPFATFIMLNPSTADAAVDDPTIRKCIGFARRWGCGGIRVVNLFAYRSTDPKALNGRRCADIDGPQNDEAIRFAFGCASGSDAPGPCVAAWGAFKHPAIEGRARDIAELAADAEVELRCLGRSADGSPRHPLMLAYTTALEAWP